MSIALIGGVDRLKRHYIFEAEKFGIDLEVFTNPELEITSKIKNVDAAVFFKNRMSNRVKKEAMAVAKTNNVLIRRHDLCGICILRDCFSC